MFTEKRLLMVEDSAFDAELLIIQLGKIRTPLLVQRVSDERELRESIAAEPPDLIVSDFNIHGMDAFHVLSIVHDSLPDCPVIVVTGTLTDELAAECIKRGAIDYLLKDKLERLPSAVERALAEKQLRAERTAAQRVLRDHAAIVSASDDAIIGLAVDETVTSWNHGAENLFGCSSADAVGKPFSSVILPADRLELGQIQAAVKEGLRVRNLETIYHRRDGKILSISLTVSPILGTEGEVLGSALIARDISERKQLEQQFLHSQKMEAVGRLAGGVAHDFNNLLTVINGYADLASAELDPGSAISMKIKSIKGAAMRAGGLTRQLLAFSRRQVLQPQIVNLNDAIKNVSAMLSRLIAANIELVTSLGTDLPLIKIDPGQLEQVILNLAVNAQDAMPSGGKLLIETAGVVGPSGAVIAVTDNGVGMDENVRSRIFEPFFTTKEEGKGTGLGLATVYGIVQQSGGVISVASEPGKGATFRICFPAADTIGGTGERRIGTETPLGGTEKILLAEDDQDVRILTATILKQHGYTVIEASTTAEACKAMDDHEGTIDLLLTDVLMPTGGVPEMNHVARATREHIPVLYTSGYTGDLLTRYGISGSEINFLEKPYTSQTLGRKVREVLLKEYESRGRNAS